MLRPISSFLSSSSPALRVGNTINHFQTLNYVNRLEFLHKPFVSPCLNHPLHPSCYDAGDKVTLTSSPAGQSNNVGRIQLPLFIGVTFVSTPAPPDPVCIYGVSVTFCFLTRAADNDTVPPLARRASVYALLRRPVKQTRLVRTAACEAMRRYRLLTDQL